MVFDQNTLAEFDVDQKDLNKLSQRHKYDHVQ